MSRISDSIRVFREDGPVYEWRVTPDQYQALKVIINKIKGLTAPEVLFSISLSTDMLHSCTTFHLTLNGSTGTHFIDAKGLTEVSECGGITYINISGDPHTREGLTSLQKKLSQGNACTIL